MSRNELLPLRVGADGWCSGVDRLPSPNFDARPEGVAVDLLLIHNISLPPAEYGGPYIAELFTNCLDCELHPYFERLRGLRVSAHFLIRRDGRIIQFVPVTMRAWHAGQSCFGSRERCNDFSIGIELEGSDFEPFAQVQYPQLARLTCALQLAMPLASVAGHEHVAPGRKSDPGPFFDWDAYLHEYTRLRAAMTPLPPASLRFPFPA